MGEERIKRKRLEDAYVAYADNLYRILRNLVKEEDTAKDIVHEAFVRYYENEDEVIEDTEFSWLVRVAKNMMNNVFRHEAQELVETSYAEKIREEEVVPSVEEEFIDNEQLESLVEFRNNVFEHLLAENSIWYETIIMVCVMDLPIKEVAARVGVSVQVIHSRLHLARQWLRKNYHDEYTRRLLQRDTLD